MQNVKSMAFLCRYDSHWGPMHWGHAVSKDLLYWEFLPAALAPDEYYDKDGCFSGSAIELAVGRQLLMYTGVVQEKQKNGVLCEVQTQCLAVGDGLDYEKYKTIRYWMKKTCRKGSADLTFGIQKSGEMPTVLTAAF